MKGMPISIFTIGHSTRPLDVFLDLLAESRIECIVDVRRLPGSRRYPQYNADALASSLASQAIDYWHLQELCGRRSKAELDGVMPDTFWRNASFGRYAAYARSPAFAEGVEALLNRALEQRCALMCSEAVWWRCHRRIIADHLLARGVPVFHIMAHGNIVAAELTRGAILDKGRVFYPAPPSDDGVADKTGRGEKA